MGIRGGYRDIMSGKPRRKKGETEKHFMVRVEDWRIDRALDRLDHSEGPVPVFERVPQINCGTCYHWGDNNQCFRYPKIVVTTERHRCGEHKTK